MFLACGGVAFCEPTPRTIAAKDFASDIPEKLREVKTQGKSLPIDITERAEIKVLLGYDSLVGHPDYFRKIEIKVLSCPKEVEVGASIGFVFNVGTAKSPLMAVPVLIQWSGAGWLRTEKWTFRANGDLRKGK